MYIYIIIYIYIYLFKWFPRMLLNMGVEFHDGFQGPEDHKIFCPSWSGKLAKIFGGSRGGDTPKWMVYNGKNHLYDGKKH